METIYLPRILELKRNLSMLEKALKVKITIKGKQATISGSGLTEYEAHLVLEAISFGFSAKKALLIKSPDFIFRRVHIKDFTRKKNLKEVKARIIGKEGKTLRTIQKISDSELILNEELNEIGIIGSAESIEETIQGIQNLIRGTKQSNVYHFLEKSNKQGEKNEGLGLK